MDFTNQTLEQIIWNISRHAERTYPFECCGIVTTDGDVIPCTNCADERRTKFRISDLDMRRVPNVAGIYHSHVDRPAYISQADKDGYTGTGVYFVASCCRGRTEYVGHYNVEQGVFSGA